MFPWSLQSSSDGPVLQNTEVIWDLEAIGPKMDQNPRACWGHGSPVKPAGLEQGGQSQWGQTVLRADSMTLRLQWPGQLVSSGQIAAGPGSPAELVAGLKKA